MLNFRSISKAQMMREYKYWNGQTEIVWAKIIITLFIYTNYNYSYQKTDFTKY